MSSINPSIEDSYVDKIVYSFSTNNMPRTPFAVSLVLAICSETSDYLPTNQSKIVESFMEKLLEKLNPSEVLSKTYHFGNKERFLAALAFEMYNNNSYYLTREQFDEFTKKYHIDKGYELKESRFDIIFFEKGLLVEYDSKIFFKYECLNYYYMAKYCFFNRPFFYENILTKEQFIKNVDIISYYAGLSLEDKKMIDTIIEFIQPYLDKHSDVGNLFDVDSIKLQLDIPDEEIKKVIEENGQVSAEEKDKLTDVPDKSNNYKPLSIKAETHFSEEMSFGVAIELLGDVIRSSEELLFSDKKPAFEKYLSGCIILWTQFRHSLLSFAQKINEELIVKKKAEEGCNYDDIKDALNKAYSNFCDIIKLSVPIAMSGFIFNCVGSEKMKVVFQDYYNSCSNDSPEKLLMLMLICDLKMPLWEKYLNEYIKQTKKKDFLWVIFFKCQYYYQFNYFGDATKKIINPLADCYIAANGNSKRKKSELIGIIQSTKRHLSD